MSSVKSYRELEIWNKSMELAEIIYRLSAKFPGSEKFGLTSQIRRAATSVPANIAEGAAREGTKEFIQFLSIAGGSIAETETFLLLAVRLGMLEEEEIGRAMELAGHVGRMINGLKRVLRGKL